MDYNYNMYIVYCIYTDMNIGQLQNYNQNITIQIPINRNNMTLVHYIDENEIYNR